MAMQWAKAAMRVGLLVLLLPAGARANPFDDCLRAGEPQRRIEGCTAVILQPEFTREQKASAYRIRGRARVEAGALDAGIADLGEAIGLDAEDGLAHAYRALARSRKGDIDGSISDYTVAIGVRRTAVTGYIGRGHAYLLKRDSARAIADFTEALFLDPKSAVAHNNRGLAHHMAGDGVRAIEDYTAAIALNPLYALAYANRAIAHEAAGKVDRAVEDNRRALLIDPALAGVRAALARLGGAEATIAESDRLMLEGRELVQSHCAGCHAIGSSGASPHPKAPPFHALQSRHQMQGLREPLTRGIAAPHDEMPKFRLPDGDIDKIVAYINALQEPGRR